ncbi:MAG: peptide chain release factor N(5)-glutamine methyltransferase [Nitrospinae bacterium]|nr:peptide chain release factor N(5)-glutamine methyltransferase [Nitrospinota bacterium]
MDDPESFHLLWPEGEVSLADLAHLGENILKGAKVPSARLDAALLLAHAIGRDTTALIAHFNEPAARDAVEKFAGLVRRRTQKEPVAYITGIKEFYSLPFRVDKSVLIPRPETEFVVDEALAYVEADSGVTALDVGVGSGAIAVAVAVARPRWRIDAVDSSAEALAVARDNAALNGVTENIEFMLSDLFTSVLDRVYDLILSNPPYIPEGSSDVLPDAELYEPHSALFAGADGLDVIRALVRQSPTRLKTGGRLIFEMDGSQAQSVKRIIEETGTLKFVKVVKDYAGLDRVVVAERV